MGRGVRGPLPVPVHLDEGIRRRSLLTVLVFRGTRTPSFVLEIEENFNEKRTLDPTVIDRHTETRLIQLRVSECEEYTFYTGRGWSF